MATTGNDDEDNDREDIPFPGPPLPPLPPPTPLELTQEERQMIERMRDTGRFVLTINRDDHREPAWRIDFLVIPDRPKVPPSAVTGSGPSFEQAWRLTSPTPHPGPKLELTEEERQMIDILRRQPRLILTIDRAYDREPAWQIGEYIPSLFPHIRTDSGPTFERAWPPLV
jgi:hypothetical protein